MTSYSAKSGSAAARSMLLGLTFVAFAALSVRAHAQEHPGTASAKGATSSAEHQEHATEEGHADDKELPEPKTDFTLLIGSDFVRPGSLPRGNLSLGIGHIFEALKKDPLGDGITFGYAYENTGTHGFFHTQYGEHSELLGQMRDFKINHSEKYVFYTWIQGGLSSLTGDDHVKNRFSSSESLGVKIHFTRSSALWVQESYNKVVTVPWYTITSIGYTYSR